MELEAFTARDRRRRTRGVQLNFAVSSTLARSLTERAAAAGQTQKQWFAGAMHQLGLEVEKDDLRNRAPRRNFG
jgi:TPR repeat protein